MILNIKKDPLLNNRLRNGREIMVLINSLSFLGGGGVLMMFTPGSADLVTLAAQHGETDCSTREKCRFL